MHELQEGCWGCGWSMEGLLQWPRHFPVLTPCHNCPQRTKDLLSIQWPPMSLLFSHFPWTISPLCWRHLLFLKAFISTEPPEGALRGKFYSSSFTAERSEVSPMKTHVTTKSILFLPCDLSLCVAKRHLRCLGMIATQCRLGSVPFLAAPFT